jgi:hypothetical protein
MFTQYMKNFWQAVLSIFSPENLILWWGKFITIIIILMVEEDFSSEYSYSAFAECC